MRGYFSDPNYLLVGKIIIKCVVPTTGNPAALVDACVGAGGVAAGEPEYRLAPVHGSPVEGGAGGAGVGAAR